MFLPAHAESGLGDEIPELQRLRQRVRLPREVRPDLFLHHPQRRVVAPLVMHHPQHAPATAHRVSDEEQLHHCRPADVEPVVARL